MLKMTPHVDHVKIIIACFPRQLLASLITHTLCGMIKPWGNAVNTVYICTNTHNTQYHDVYIAACIDTVRQACCNFIGPQLPNSQSFYRQFAVYQWGVLIISDLLCTCMPMTKGGYGLTKIVVRPYIIKFWPCISRTQINYYMIL